MRFLGRPLGTLRSQVQFLVGSLLVLLLVSAVGTFLVQRQVTATQAHLRAVLRPAQVAVAKLGEAYVDQETGARGYQLTGDKVFLQPYSVGVAMAARLSQQLAKSLASDTRSARLLDQLRHDAANWRRNSAASALAGAQIPRTSAGLHLALTEKAFFDALRRTIAALSTRINALAAAEVARINSAQAADNLLTLAAGLFGVLLVFVAALMLRNSLSRPLTSLRTQVKRVAEGDLGHSVVVTGPAELATVGGAVETMRVRILAQTARAMEMQRQLDLTEESERIAGGLQDLVIRRLSGTGLALQSAAARHPSTAAALSNAVDEIDMAIRELRAVIFGLTAGRASGGLRKRVLNLVSESEPGLGFTPQLQFDGIASTGVTGTVSDALISALREILSDISRHPDTTEAAIHVNMSNGALRLRVTDNRPASAEVRELVDSLAKQAERLGGTCTVGTSPGSATTIEWVVPAHGAVVGR